MISRQDAHISHRRSRRMSTYIETAKVLPRPTRVAGAAPRIPIAGTGLSRSSPLHRVPNYQWRDDEAQRRKLFLSKLPTKKVSTRLYRTMLSIPNITGVVK